MRNFTVTVDTNGKIELSEQFVGYGGEHNSVSLSIGFTTESIGLYGQADYFRIVVDGIYSDKLYMNDNALNYILPQEVMNPPEVHCQLLGYSETDKDISSIVKSEVFGLKVAPSQVPYKKADTNPDIFEKTVALCSSSAESASRDAALALDYANRAAGSAGAAETAAMAAALSAEDALNKAIEAETSADRAEQILEKLDGNNFSNALKGNASGEVIKLEDISPVQHEVNIQLSNADGTPLVNTVETVIPEVSYGTEDGISWDDVPGWTQSISPLEVGVDNLKVTARLTGDIYIAPLVNGNFSTEWGDPFYIRAHWLDAEQTAEISYTIENGSLSWSGSFVNGDITESEVGAYEHTFNADEKLTGIWVMTESPSNSWVTLSVKTAVNDVTVIVTDENEVEYLYKPDLSGSLSVPSMYPLMSFKTDSDGVVIDVQYNKDTNKSFNDICNNVTNALKGEASGEFVYIDDVSPIEHNMKIKLVARTASLKDTKLVKCENLLTNDIVSQGDFVIKEGVYSSSCNAWETLTLKGSYLNAGTEYTVRVNVLDFKLNSNGNNLTSYAVCLKYVDEENVPHESGKLELNKLGWVELKYTPKVSGVYDFLCFGRSDKDGSVSFTTPQVISRKHGTEYDFVEDEVDGNGYLAIIEDVKSVYPSFILTTNTPNAIIQCEYNRDINKAFAELYKAIISLGGNI